MAKSIRRLRTKGNAKFLNGNHEIFGTLSFINNSKTVAFFAEQGLGIGTTVPSRPLNIVSKENEIARLENTQDGGDCVINYRTSYGTDVNWAAGIDGSDDSFRIANSPNVGATDRFTINSLGYVGIGTTNPSRQLNVVSTENEVLRLENIQSGGDCVINCRTSYGTDVNWAIGAKGSDDSFRISNSTNVGTTDRLTIDSLGNIGIGAVAPLEKLEVNGGIKVGSSTGTNLGTIRWSGSDLEVYKTGGWVSLTSGAGSGTLIRTRNAIVTNYTVTSTDSIIGVNATAAMTITLPAANAFSAGHCLLIKDEAGNAATNNIQIAAPAGSLIDGASSMALTINNSAINIYSDGTSKYFLY